MYSIISSAGGGALFICKAHRPLCFLRHICSSPPKLTPRSKNSKLTHYQILGLEKDATSEEIRNAFLRLSKDYHPDINSDDPRNHDKFVEVNEAYSILSKPLLRREYDSELLLRSKLYNPNIPRQYPDGRTSHFYDPQFYANRDRSQDAYYASKPYYGVKGVPKVSNRAIVYICMAIVVIGAAFHFVVVKTLSDIHIENLNARDKRNHQIWMDAKNPDNIPEKIQLMRIKIKQEEEEKRREKGVDDTNDDK